MRWDDLRYLEAVARTGSATAAARELDVAASTVYRRVAALEEALGAACIVKGSSPAELTDAGRALVAAATGVRAAVTSARDHAADRAQRIAGVVGVTTVEGFLPYLSEPLKRAVERHPELRIELHLADVGPSVWRREVDLAIAVARNPPEGLVGRRLAPVRYGLYGTAAAMAERPRRWVITGGPRAHIDEAVWEREHAERIALSTNSRNAMIELVRAGVGVAVLPRRLAARHAELIEDPSHRASLAPLERPVWLLTHPELKETARVRAVFDLLLESLE